MDSGNAVVDQFTHGRREGPIQMECFAAGGYYFGA
jgi:hypothetical protein